MDKIRFRQTKKTNKCFFIQFVNLLKIVIEIICYDFQLDLFSNSNSIKKISWKTIVVVFFVPILSFLNIVETDIESIN